jgi:hypothetical protein
MITEEEGDFGKREFRGVEWTGLDFNTGGLREGNGGTIEFIGPELLTPTTVDFYCPPNSEIMIRNVHHQ